MIFDLQINKPRPRSKDPKQIKYHQQVKIKINRLTIQKSNPQENHTGKVIIELPRMTPGNMFRLLFGDKGFLKFKKGQLSFVFLKTQFRFANYV